MFTPLNGRSLTRPIASMYLTETALLALMVLIAVLSRVRMAQSNLSTVGQSLHVDMLSTHGQGISTTEMMQKPVRKVQRFRLLNKLPVLVTLFMQHHGVVVPEMMQRVL